MLTNTKTIGCILAHLEEEPNDLFAHGQLADLYEEMGEDKKSKTHRLFVEGKVKIILDPRKLYSDCRVDLLIHPSMSATTPRGMTEYPSIHDEHDPRETAFREFHRRHRDWSLWSFSCVDNAIEYLGRCIIGKHEGAVSGVGA